MNPIHFGRTTIQFHPNQQATAQKALDGFQQNLDALREFQDKIVTVNHWTIFEPQEGRCVGSTAGYDRSYYQCVDPDTGAPMSGVLCDDPSHKISIKGQFQLPGVGRQSNMMIDFPATPTGQKLEGLAAGAVVSALVAEKEQQPFQVVTDSPSAFGMIFHRASYTKPLPLEQYSNIQLQPDPSKNPFTLQPKTQ